MAPSTVSDVRRAIATGRRLVRADPRIALARARGEGSGDRIEAEGLAFHAAVRRGFLALAAAEPQRFAVIDASASLDEIESRVAAVVGERL